MIVARRVSLLAALALGLPGCFSLPAPAPATARSEVGDAAPVFTLARTGPSPGKLCLPTGTGAATVLVFYRGEW